jgi:hypothetical protein
VRPVVHTVRRPQAPGKRSSISTQNHDPNYWIRTKLGSPISTEVLEAVNARMHRFAAAIARIATTVPPTTSIK